MENGNFSWKNWLYMAIFNSIYMLNCQKVVKFHICLPGKGLTCLRTLHRSMNKFPSIFGQTVEIRQAANLKNTLILSTYYIIGPPYLRLWDSLTHSMSMKEFWVWRKSGSSTWSSSLTLLVPTSSSWPCRFRTLKTSGHLGICSTGWWFATFFIFPYWEESSQLTNTSQRGSNHQPVNVISVFFFRRFLLIHHVWTLCRIHWIHLRFLSFGRPTLPYIQV